jgi:acyl-CoA dehydrogenase
MLQTPDAYQEIREAIRSLCAEYPDEYFRKIDEQRDYPESFVDALTQAGWLAAMIPQEYGGSGLGLAEASVIMEEINRNGGNAGACHGQMYNMGTLLRHGSQQQKEFYLPKIATGEWRLQSMGVTEPTTGTDTTKIKTTAVKKGDRYVVNGQKVWISRVQHSDWMILLARTTPLADVKRKSEGMSIFMVDLKKAIGRVHWRRLLVHRPGQSLCQGSCGLWPTHRPEPGGAVPDRGRLHRGRGRQPHALQGL